MKLAIIAPSPIQHFCPQYRSLAKHVSLRVFFSHLGSVDGYVDHDFGREVAWGPDLLSGYDWAQFDNSFRQLSKKLSAFDPDAIIVYGHSTYASRAGWVWKLARRRVRLFYVADSEFRHYSSRWRKFKRRLLLRIPFRIVDTFLTVGDANEQFYESCGARRDKFVRMHFPINLDMLSSSPSNDQPNSPGEHKLVLLNVGKFIPRKRQLELISVAREFDASEVQLVLVGSGPLDQQLRAAAEGLENVTFTGFLDPAEIVSLYRSADIYLHPSDLDPHPLAVSEALALGCAVVVSEATGSWGPTDDVRPAYNGFVHRVGDTRQMVGAVRDYLNDRSKLLLHQQRSAALAREHQQRAHGGFLNDIANLSDRGKGDV